MTNRTPGQVRHKILAAVDGALRKHYGENYSMRCAQASQAIANLLERSGVPATVVRGQACVAQVIGERITWMCFGGASSDDSGGREHCWVQTAHELVDLTIWQHHLAPGAAAGGVPCPALWLNDGAAPPPSNKYLPRDQRGRISVAFNDPGDDAHLRRFLDDVGERYDQLDGVAEPDLPFELLSAGDDMERLRAQSDPWVCALWSTSLPPLPAWAQLRNRELRPGR